MTKKCPTCCKKPMILRAFDVGHGLGMNQGFFQCGKCGKVISVYEGYDLENEVIFR